MGRLWTFVCLYFQQNIDPIISILQTDSHRQVALFKNHLLHYRFNYNRTQSSLPFSISEEIIRDIYQSVAHVAAYKIKWTAESYITWLHFPMKDKSHLDFVVIAMATNIPMIQGDVVLWVMVSPYFSQHSGLITINLASSLCYHLDKCLTLHGAACTVWDL